MLWCQVWSDWGKTPITTHLMDRASGFYIVLSLYSVSMQQIFLSACSSFFQRTPFELLCAKLSSTLGTEQQTVGCGTCSLGAYTLVETEKH